MTEINQYYEQCVQFFKQDKYSQETIENLFANLNEEQQWQWYLDAYNEYHDKNIHVLKELREQQIDNTTFSAYRLRFDNAFKIFDDYKIISQMKAKHQDNLLLKSQNALLNVSIDGVQYRAEKRIDVLWSGWECDESAWLINKDGQKCLVMSNHGQTYIADKKELQDRIDAYKSAIQESQELLKLLEN